MPVSLTCSNLYSRLILASVVICLTPSVSSGADFQSLSELVIGFGHDPSVMGGDRITGISQDGRVFAGGGWPFPAFRYSIDTGFHTFAADGPMQGAGQPLLSDTGDEMAWTGIPSQLYLGTPTLQAEYWSSDSGRRRIGGYGPSQSSSTVAIAGDGGSALVFDFAFPGGASTSLAFESGGAQQIPFPPDDQIRPNGMRGGRSMSSDGFVIADGSNLWTQASGAWSSLGMAAHDMTGDGGMIVGQAPAGGAAKWTPTGGVELLPALPGHTNSVAELTSSDGRVIAGTSDGEPVLWLRKQSPGGSTGTEIVAVNDFLTANGITSQAGWTFTDVDAISADGSFVVGRGVNPADPSCNPGVTCSWVIDTRQEVFLDFGQPGEKIDFRIEKRKDPLGNPVKVHGREVYDRIPGSVTMDFGTVSDKDALVAEVQRRFDEIGLSNVRVVHEEPAGFTALTVYMAEPPETDWKLGGRYLGVAYDAKGPDRFDSNLRLLDEEAVVFVDGSDIDRLAEVVLHETGHAMGLYHVYADDLTPGIMDYVRINPELATFRNKEIEASHPPKPGGKALGFTHNPRFHLLKYVGGFSDEELASMTPQVLPGDWDKASFSPTKVSVSLTNASDGDLTLYDVLIIEAADDLGDDVISIAQTLAEFDEISLSELAQHSFELEQGSVLSLIASMEPGGAFDVGLGRMTPDLEFALHHGVVPGASEAVLYAETSSPVGFEALASLTIQAIAVPEPAALWMLLTLAWPRVARSRCVNV